MQHKFVVICLKQTPTWQSVSSLWIFHILAHVLTLFLLKSQIWNHNFYFKSLKKGAEAEPVGILAAMIVEAFGSFKEFQHQFTTEALKHFGSGWVWLVLNSDGKLAIVATHDAANPLQHDLIPLLTCDVWEHAYYIDYRNARPRYLHSWWKLINWDFASANLENASSSSP